jgi:hypothetical protein
MSLSLVLTAMLTISAAVVILSSLESSVNAIIVNNTDFSVNVPNNWAYRQSINNPLAGALAKVFDVNPPLTLIPNEFTNLLVNTSQEFSGKVIQNGGAYSRIALDTDYPYRNIPLETYTQYNIHVSPVKIFSKQNATIDGEKAIKIQRTPRDNSTNVQVLDYYVIHEDKPYTLQYVANVNDFQKYLPQFEQMAKTFKFIK